MSLQATVIRNILQAAAVPGTTYEKLCRLANIMPEEMNDSEDMMEWEKATLIWDVLLRLTGDELIGLHIGMEMEVRNNGMVGFLLQSSKNLEQAFQLYARYNKLVAPMLDFRYVDGKEVYVEMEQNKLWLAKYPELARQAMDWTIAAVLKNVWALSGKKIMPLRLEVAYPKRNILEYRRLLGCEAVFDAEINRLFFRQEDMQLPVLTHDKSMFERFNAIVAEKHATMHAGQNMTQQLKQLLLFRFKGRIPALEEAAIELDVSPRTLQRKLLEEGTRFRIVAHEVQKEIALQLMKNPATKLSEVSDVLGYSDPTAFRRAFKSWTKETPKAVKGALRNRTSV